MKRQRSIHQLTMKNILALGLVIFVTSFPGAILDAEVIPAFARKYQVNCQVCHHGNLD